MPIRPRVRSGWRGILATAALMTLLGFSFLLTLGGILLAVGVIYFSSIGIDAPHDPNKEVLTGDAARAYFTRIVSGGIGPIQNGVGFPASAEDFWIYDGGTFNGSIRYGLFDCDGREDCFQAVEFLAGLRPDQFMPWAPSRYAVVMEGLDFYARGATNRIPLKSNPWDVRGIEDGVVFESADDEHRRMDYYAIDFARNRVYYHYESGGFPPDEYRPDGAVDNRPARAR
jgi:hypothetical protein